MREHVAPPLARPSRGARWFHQRGVEHPAVRSQLWRDRTAAAMAGSGARQVIAVAEAHCKAPPERKARKTRAKAQGRASCTSPAYPVLAAELALSRYLAQRGWRCNRQPSFAF